MINKMKTDHIHVTTAEPADFYIANSLLIIMFDPYTVGPPILEQYIILRVFVIERYK